MTPIEAADTWCLVVDEVVRRHKTGDILKFHKCHVCAITDPDMPLVLWLNIDSPWGWGDSKLRIVAGRVKIGVDELEEANDSSAVIRERIGQEITSMLVSFSINLW